MNRLPFEFYSQPETATSTVIFKTYRKMMTQNCGIITHGSRWNLVGEPIGAGRYKIHLKHQ